MLCYDMYLVHACKLCSSAVRVRYNAMSFTVELRINNHCCPGKILLIDEKTIIARVSGFCKSRGLATMQPDTSTLGDASFYQWHFYFFTGIDEPAVSVSLLKLNNGMAECLLLLS